MSEKINDKEMINVAYTFIKSKNAFDPSIPFQVGLKKLKGEKYLIQFTDDFGSESYYYDYSNGIECDIYSGDILNYKYDFKPIEKEASKIDDAYADSILEADTNDNAEILSIFIDDAMNEIGFPFEKMVFQNKLWDTNQLDN